MSSPSQTPAPPSSPLHAAVWQLVTRWSSFLWIFKELLERDRRFEESGDDGDLVLRVGYKFGKRNNRPKVTEEVHHRAASKRIP